MHDLWSFNLPSLKSLKVRSFRCPKVRNLWSLKLLSLKSVKVCNLSSLNVHELWSFKLPSLKSLKVQKLRSLKVLKLRIVTRLIKGTKLKIDKLHKAFFHTFLKESLAQIPIMIQFLVAQCKVTETRL